MITIYKINKKYILTILLTFIFAFSSLPLDILSFTGISPSDSTTAFAKSSGRSSSSSSKSSSSGFKSGSVGSSSGKSATSSKSAEGFKSGSFSDSSSSTKSDSSTSSKSDGAAKGFGSGSYSTTDKNKTQDSSNTNDNKSDNTQNYSNGSHRGSFLPFVGGFLSGSFFRPFYFGSTSSSLLNVLVLGGIFVLVIIFIKKNQVKVN